MAEMTDDDILAELGVDLTPKKVRARTPREERIGAIGIGDVDLDHDQVRAVVRPERLDMIVDQLDLVVGGEEGGQRRQAERWKQRIFYRPPEGALRLGERRQDHLDLHRSCSST